MSRVSGGQVLGPGFGARGNRSLTPFLYIRCQTDTPQRLVPQHRQSDGVQWPCRRIGCWRWGDGAYVDRYRVIYHWLLPCASLGWPRGRGPPSRSPALITGGLGPAVAGASAWAPAPGFCRRPWTRSLRAVRRIRRLGAATFSRPLRASAAGHRSRPGKRTSAELASLGFIVHLRSRTRDRAINSRQRELRSRGCSAFPASRRAGQTGLGVLTTTGAGACFSPG